MKLGLNSSRTLVLFLLFCAVAAVILAQNLEDRVVEHRLNNGMTFLLMERHQAPVFTGMIVFKVGSVDEESGKTGLAHLLEHMFFKGTKVLGTRNYRAEERILEKIDDVGTQLSKELSKGKSADKERVATLRDQIKKLQAEAARYQDSGEIAALYARHGGTQLNATTSDDVTKYFVSLPSNRLELWAMVESDKMANLVFREFYSERDVVMEERRLRVESNPAGTLDETFFATAFIAHPYRRPTLGWMSDLASLTVRDAQRFYDTYCVPSNAVAAIVGDIDVKQTVRIVERYFGRLPARDEPARVVTAEPAQSGERRVTLELDAEPQLLIGYHKPTLPHPNDYVFDVIDSILSRGRTSRLYAKLVKELKFVTSVSTWQGAPGGLYDNLFVFEASPRHPHTAAEVEAVMFAEIDKLKAEPVSERELQKVRNQIQADFIRALDSNFGLASQLSYFQVVAGDWKYVVRSIAEIDKVTAQDVQRVASQYFVKENRTVAAILRKAPPTGQRTQ